MIYAAVAAFIVLVGLISPHVANAQPPHIAESFARHRSVLSCPGGESHQDYEQCAFEFMRRVACDHQGEIALWPKNGGTHCIYNGRGYDCDKLVMLASGEMYDIVASAGIPSQSPTWNLVATGVLGGTVPPPACGGGQPSDDIPIAEAAERIFTTFQRVHERAPEQVEVDAMAAYARSRGWNGGDRIASSIVNDLVVLIERYSGDINNPFPVLDPNVAFQQIRERFVAKFGRPLRPIEESALSNQLRTRGYIGGPFPEWLLKEVFSWIDAYDGSYGANLAHPVTSGAVLSVLGNSFALNGNRFEWRGQTAFLLFYDYTFNRPQYQRFRDAAYLNKVNVLRVSVATSPGYLALTPQSGGTFGLGRTTPLFPGSPHWSWPAYRSMVEDLNAYGIVPEIVPFLTTGPMDQSDPRMVTTAGRIAYLEEVALELLSVRAAFVEIANEYNFIGFPDDGLEIVGMAQRYKQIDPARLVALSAPSGPGDTANAHLMASGDYITVHADRRTDPSYAWVVRQFGLPQLYFGKPVVNDEGINADTVGEFGNDADPRNHFINGVTTQLIQMSYTFHYDRGLKGLEPSSVDGSHPAYVAWRMGLDLVPFDLPGQLYQATSLGATPGFPFVSLGGSAASAGRADGSSGVFVFYGVPAGFVVQAAPGWNVELLADVQLHKVYRLSR